MPLFTVVFDIDETIATSFDHLEELEESEWFYANHFYCMNIEFEMDGRQINMPHVIHRGVIEAIKLIDSMPGVRLSFFSSGVSQRNTIFVKKLLCFALGEDRYNAIESQIEVYSREDLDKDSQKKNLTTVVNDKDLPWTVLIDDNITNIVPGQENNFVLMPAMKERHFHEMSADLAFGNKWGRDLFLRANHLFYVTGLLFFASQSAKKENITLAAALSKIQRDESGGFRYELHTEINYYHLGLEKLRQVNPELCFLGDEFSNDNVSYVDFYSASPINSAKEEEKTVSHSPGLFKALPAYPFLVHLIKTFDGVERSGKSKENLERFSKSLGFNCKDMPPDGNCFFHAVLDQLQHKEDQRRELSHQDLRQMAIDEVKKTQINTKDLFIIKAKDNFFVRMLKMPLGLIM